ncbi:MULTISPECIES: hypothetical protein [Streptomyces]|uniref:hypothetical protein n=1 Tax=Streptomyces TaxID=1883 RepID=UPI001F60BDB7|nr:MULTISPECIES: hypothetical protein [Streptomyces]
MTTLAAPAPAAAISPPRRWAVLAVVLAAEILDLLDSTITNLAAPTIAADLHGGESLVQWLGAGSGQAHAVTVSLLLVAGATGVSCCLVRLLPRNAQPRHH